MNAQDRQGNTPLHYCRNMLILRLLFKFDVDPLITNRKRLTPSENYRASVPEEDQDADLWGELARREEARVLSNQRKALARRKEMEERRLLVLASHHQAATSSAGAHHHHHRTTMTAPLQVAHGGEGQHTKASSSMVAAGSSASRKSITTR